MSRGCPRGCGFCHVAAKEGRESRKVADLREFWNGQGDVVLLDPNPVACADWRDILGQLAESRACVDFTQGLDIRMMTPEKAEMVRKVRVRQVHFAWDRYEDRDAIVPKLREFAEVTGWGRGKMACYVLTNYDTTMEQDLERIYTLRDLGYAPYMMIYDKEHVPKGHVLRRMQRWVNNRFIFNSCQKFEDYRP